MKKFFIGITILGGAFFLLIIIARLTGILQFYRCTSTAMSPGIELNEPFFSTNLLHPKHRDIIVLKRETDEKDGIDPGTTIRCIYRLIATGGEKLQVKNGLAYVNDTLADDSTRLKFYYAFSAKKNLAVMSVLYPGKTEPPGSEWMPKGDDSILALCTHQQFIAIPLVKTFFENPDMNLYRNNTVKNWTTNNYGPVFVPVGQYFKIGRASCRERVLRLV